tara:strand:+ start:91 stop:624 length:534 start_codon:yes stop_codon:yes gene_type:complete
MPFCRECGKQVEDDWVSCPFCSQPIGPPASAMLGLQDSVVMGDINISKSGGEPTSCSNCGASGSVKLACSKCKSHCTCEVCVDDFRNKLVEEFIDSGRYVLYKPKELRCRSCFEKYLKNKCRSVCGHCKCKFSKKEVVFSRKDFCYECSLSHEIATNPRLLKKFEMRKDIHASYHSQ